MNKIELYIFHTGKVKVDRAIPLHECNPLAKTGIFRGDAKKMILPVSTYLIVHPEGNVLIDTGWNTKYAFERPKQLFGMVDRISTPIIGENNGVDNKLKAIGLTPSDIDHVFISHMDFDHTSGLRLVDKAKDIRCSEEEWEACNKCSLRYIDTWTGICNVGTFAFKDNGIGPTGRCYDVFKDGTLLLVHTPGHSRGHFSVMIQGKDGYIILGNDAAYLPESFSEHNIPGFIVNKKLAEKSLDWLIRCKNDPECIGVYVNHDPTVKELKIEVKI